jgi:hypothetical protein
MASPKDTKSGIKLDEFRKDYLFGLPSQLRPASEWSESFLVNKIRSAEDALERDLGIYYTPKRVVCEPKDTLVQGKDYDIAEAAYDYSTQFFVGENWGGIRLRKYPIHVTPTPTITFAYPNIDHKIFTVPPTWVRVNGPYGMIRLVPDAIAIYASFTAFILSVFSGGMGIPQSVFVNYTAGFSGVEEKADLEADYRDLLELTKQKAVLNIVDDAFMPGSMTNSTDGISQTFSYQVKDLREGFDKKVTQFRNKVKGIRLGVV